MQIYLHSQIVPLDISEDKNHRQKPIKRARGCCVHGFLVKSYNKDSSITTAAMAMGKQQEAQILARYFHQQRVTQPDTSVQGEGFLIDKEYGWLGASPDAVVTDNSSKRCAEIKAPVSLRYKSITEADL